MIRQKRQEGVSPPPVVYVSLGVDLNQPAPEGHYWISLHRKILRYREGEVVEEPQQSIPLFLEIKNEFRHMDLSPDGQYYYYAGVSFTYCGRVGDASSKPIVLNGLYRCKFSPDSRFLCGYGGREEEEMMVVDCVTGRVRRLATPEYPRDTEDPNADYRFGWYPDSRHIWYQEDTSEVRRDYHRGRAYKQDVVSGRRWVLKGRQLDEVYREWALLDPRYRWGPVRMDGSAFRYSPRQQVRVRVQPPPTASYLELRPGRQQVSVEWRDGRSRVVIERGQHPWVRILPRDVTEDGRWVLLSVGKQKDEENFHSELLAVEVPTGRRYSYVQLSGKGVGLVGTQRLETPYDRPLYQFWRGEANT